jgi:MFS family permease
MFFLLNVFVAPASQLQNDYLRGDRGFSGSTITLFTLLTATPGAIGVIVGGRWADTRGRRAALIPGLLAIGVFNAIMFSVAGVPMWISSLLGSVMGGLCIAALGVLGPELFPTARRGGVRGALTVIAVVGSVTGLLVAGASVDVNGYGPTFVLLALGPIIAAGLAFAVPETSRRELEDINRPT